MQNFARQAYNYLASIYESGLIKWAEKERPTEWSYIELLEEIGDREAMLSVAGIYKILLKEFKEMPTFNFEGTETRPAIPLGDYLVQVMDCTLKSDANGAPQYFGLKMQIISESVVKGSFMWDNLSLTQKSYPRLKGALDSMGITQPGTQPIINIEATHFVGRQCAVRYEEVVDKRDGSKKPGLGWNGYLLPGTGPVAAAPAVQAAAPVAIPAQAPITPPPAVMPTMPGVPVAQPAAQPVQVPVASTGPGVVEAAIIAAGDEVPF